MPLWTFVRHGQSRANAEGWLAGVHDAPLTRLGQTQALEARPAMAELPFSRVFSSDSSRARDTARLIVHQRPAPRISTRQLRERHCGIYETRRIAELQATGEMATLSEWSVRPPGGESLRDVAVRAITWLAREDIDQDTLVVAHGALIRSVIGLVDGRSTSQIGLWRPRNCQAVRRDLPVGSWAELRDRLLRSSWA